MALQDYTNPPRSDGYRCYRVTWTENGKQKQKWFPADHKEEAEMWNDYYAKKFPPRSQVRIRRHSQQYNFKAPRFVPARHTAVVGITIGFNVQRRCSPIRYYPCMFFCFQDKHSGIRKNGSRCITSKRDIEATWRQCCEMLSGWRKYDEVPQSWYDACPTYEDFDKLRRWYGRRGTKIAKSNLQIILTGERA